MQAPHEHTHTQMEKNKGVTQPKNLHLAKGISFATVYA